jgi:dUTP pyrophosphatase
MASNNNWSAQYLVLFHPINAKTRSCKNSRVTICMEDNEFLAIYVRSSLGFKHDVRICNQVIIIDADYYNNEDNEGHILVRIKNEGDKEVSINKGDRLVQGIFTLYLITDDDNATGIRKGGIGSTNKGDDNNG